MKAALIGLGMVAETHVRAIADAAGVTLAGVMSRDATRAQAFANRMASVIGTAPHVFPDLAAIAASDVDFVILCTPPDSRADIVATLVAAGKPILMEKPVERTAKAARAIVDICAAAGVPLGVVFQHRFRPDAMALHDLLASDGLGTLAAVQIDLPWWRPQSYYDEPGRGTYARDGGGVLITQAIHILDLALTFTGPVSRVQAMARTTALHRMEGEDFVTAGLDYASGAVGSLVATTASRPGGGDCITLHCANGSARLVHGRLTIDWADGTTENIGLSSETGGGADPMAFGHAWHQAAIEDFAAALRDGRNPTSTGAEALRIHVLIEAIIRSSTEGRAVEIAP
ncbi:MAG: Gfo/Idh/MocA family oxidoreductase [Jannaschia helgolandensis]|jgi:predicted dehydrogenase|uniref:Predicted dehydrogenase n=1 Tax=Jannaschia helgolandensis TaxID=188906 RepID=A0A1H7SCC2_9RHOB|nr:Gfo/Idh/MocA family oxidoreductase [Jannaschia helgolandensis]SEL69846.1 Predicted dehydrogenase [Jannaschia helgolandensis]